MASRPAHSFGHLRHAVHALCRSCWESVSDVHFAHGASRAPAAHFAASTEDVSTLYRQHVDRFNSTAAGRLCVSPVPWLLVGPRKFPGWSWVMGFGFDRRNTLHVAYSDNGGGGLPVVSR